MTKKLTRIIVFLLLLLLCASSYLAYVLYINHTTGFLDTKNNQIIYKTRDGVQLFGLQEIDGDTYYFSQDEGYMHRGFLMQNHEQYYFDDQGRMAHGLTSIGQRYAYFDKSGKMIKNKYQEVERNKLKQTSYFDENGYMVIGSKVINGIPEYFDENGKHVFNKNYLLEGVNDILNRYSGNVRIYFKDLTSQSTFTIHDELSFYPCCMIKVPVLAAIYDEIYKGNINYEQYKYQIEKMITISDNTSYNEMMYALGGNDPIKGCELVNAYVKKIGLTDTYVGHGLRPGYGYFTTNTVNKTSPKDLGLLFEKLYRKEIVNKQASHDMLELLKRCYDPDEIQAGLPKDIPFAHKTGVAYANYHDGGIIFTPHRDYILIIFSDQVQGYNAMMQEISKFIYDYIALLPNGHV